MSKRADRWDAFTLQELDLLRQVGATAHAQGYSSAQLAERLEQEIDAAIRRLRSSAVCSICRGPILNGQWHKHAAE